MSKVTFSSALTTLENNPRSLTTDHAVALVEAAAWDGVGCDGVARTLRIVRVLARDHYHKAIEVRGTYGANAFELGTIHFKRQFENDIARCRGQSDFFCESIDRDHKMVVAAEDARTRLSAMMSVHEVVLAIDEDRNSISKLSCAATDAWDAIRSW